MLKRVATSAVTLGLAIMAASCVKQKPGIDFALQDSTGKTQHLSDYRGKVVLLNFWATWCSPCKVEIPWFVEFQSKYRGADFAVLGVSMDEDGWDSVRPYMKDHKFNYPIVVGNDAVGRLFASESRKIDPHAGAEIDDLPTTFLIDREGQIEQRHVGLISKDKYQEEIASLIKGEVLRGAVTRPSNTFALWLPGAGR